MQSQLEAARGQDEDDIGHAELAAVRLEDEPTPMVSESGGEASELRRDEAFQAVGRH